MPGSRSGRVNDSHYLTFFNIEVQGPTPIIYTLVECAKRYGHDPEVWLTDVLQRLPAMTNRKRSTDGH